MTERVIKPIRRETQTREVNIYGPEGYVNNELDSIFKRSEKDPNRHKEHVGWWTFEQCLFKPGNSNWAKVLWDLPFRFEDELNPLDNLPRMLDRYKDMDIEDRQYMKEISSICMLSKIREFNLWEPDEPVRNRYEQFRREVESVLHHFESPDEFPNPRSFLDG